MTTMMLAPLPKGVEDTPEIREALQRWCDGRAEAAVRETPRRLIAKWREYANKAERHIADAGMEIENETHMRDMRMCADELEAASEPPTQPAMADILVVNPRVGYLFSEIRRHAGHTNFDEEDIFELLRPYVEAKLQVESQKLAAAAPTGQSCVDCDANDRD